MGQQEIMDVVYLSTESVILLSMAIVFASAITSITGMAGGVLMFSAMSVFMPVKPLIAIHGVVQVFNNAARGWFLRAHIRWAMCFPFLIGTIMGAALTTFFIVQYVGQFFPLLILVLLIVYTLFKPKRLPQVKIRDKYYFLVGIATGCMGIIVGAIDPLLAVFFMRDDMTKEEIVCNKSMMQLFTHLTKIPAFLFLGFSFFDNAFLIMVLSLAAIFGAKLGIVILRYVSTSVFFLLMKAALFIAAGRIIYQLIQLGV
ncbi:sulfite exporter TauE/SafE family protein [Marinomonas sp. A79]|uniref:Probable membrane transporter protein n=1 Tax=Marinomonas vulgaris TaxID=2823372 RepID=A0ABS5HFQ3_9GAMM|nr:sulfite exporter TauE/SafE family protein [Marinomonas vulgaris]MBR7890227.1 sulfite exporter TauE/SafE family protein [Marinomonas vulgaris]